MTGEAKSGSTSTSTKQHHGHPGLGQHQVQSRSSLRLQLSHQTLHLGRPETNHQGEDLTRLRGRKDNRLRRRLHTSISPRWHDFVAYARSGLAATQQARSLVRVVMTYVAPGSPVPNPIPAEDALASSRVGSEEYLIGLESLCAAWLMRSASAQARSQELLARSAAARVRRQWPGSQRVAIQASPPLVDPSLPPSHPYGKLG